MGTTKKEPTFRVTFVFNTPIPPLVLTGVSKFVTKTTNGKLSEWQLKFESVEEAQKLFPAYIDIDSVAYITRTLEK